MRHKYATRAIVLARSPLAEAASLVTLLTEDLGLLRARAEGLRKPGSKLSSALQALCESDVILVRGKEGWRIAGAVLRENWFVRLSHTARLRVGRVAGLLLRLVHGEGEGALYPVFLDFLSLLPDSSEEAGDARECLAALKILSSLVLDAGTVPEIPADAVLAPELRRELVLRINRGISASGL